MNLRVGPRVPLTVGPLVMAAGTLLLATVEPGDRYLTKVFPALVVFGLGLATVVAPITATVLAAADDRHSGIASGFNNAVSRVGQLLAVAILPVIAELSGNDYRDPGKLTTGFHTATIVTAGLAALGGTLAAVAIRSEVLTHRRAGATR